jgi:hypothetical protein
MVNPMTLAAKIAMCIQLWAPDGLHSSSADLLSRWYNQEMEIVARLAEGEEPPLILSKPFIAFKEIAPLLSLPNSDYLNIPSCIQSRSEGV